MKRIYQVWKIISERRLRTHYNKHYSQEIRKYREAKDKKEKSVIVREMRTLKQYWGCYPFQYIRYGMYRRECTQSIEEMKNDTDLEGMDLEIFDDGEHKFIFKEGDEEGDDEGSDEGDDEGNNEGDDEGCIDGCSLGLALGIDDGSQVCST